MWKRRQKLPPFDIDKARSIIRHYLEWLDSLNETELLQFHLLGMTPNSTALIDLPPWDIYVTRLGHDAWRIYAMPPALTLNLDSAVKHLVEMRQSTHIKHHHWHFQTFNGPPPTDQADTEDTTPKRTRRKRNAN